MESKQLIKIDQKYKVLVGCFTYNQSEYILDALNGFASQKTNFPFACVIMDDASTDGEQQIIKKWLDDECDMSRSSHYELDLSNVIVVPHKTNLNCTIAVYFLKSQLFHSPELKLELYKPWIIHSEYLAYCDGDDFWDSPEKIQLQAECLDEYPNINLCVHRYRLLNQKTATFKDCPHYSNNRCVIPLKDIILSDYQPAAGTLFLRTSLFSSLPEFVTFFVYDMTVIIYGSMNGGAYYFPDYLSVYRTNIPSSISSLMLKKGNRFSDFYEKEKIMLEKFDKETHYQYHQKVQSRILLISTPYTNSAIRNIGNTIKYRKAFRELPRIYRLRIIAKCICPRLGHLIYSIVLSVFKQVPFLS